jgi:hypothetical protein
MTDETGAPQPKQSPDDPPAANQSEDEPIPDAAGQEQVPDETDGVDETHGVPVAKTYGVGSSGEGASARGGIPVVAPAGKPDGEVDTHA